MSLFFQDFLDKLALIPGIIFAFFLLFIIHELGHYWAARLRSMKIETFSVGVGKRLWGVTDRHGTEWIFRLWPLGGHVEISDLTLDENTQSRRSVGSRLFVVLAGPVSNLLLPFIVLPVCFLLIGLPVRPPVISGVEEGHPAALAGLMRGDFVTALDGQKLWDYDDLGDVIETSKGRMLHLTIERNGKEQTVSVTPQHEVYKDIVNIDRDRYVVGILNANLSIPLGFIRNVNGIDTEDKEDLARQEVIKIFDQPARIGLMGQDDKTHYYDLILPADLNQHLFDEHHKYYERVYLGPLHDNAFITLPPLQLIKKGLYEAATLYWYLVQVPLQIFPLDPHLYAERVPFEPESPFYLRSLIYRALYTAAVLSIVIAFVNLVPIPHLDGDFILTYVMEGMMRKKPTRRQRALAIGISLFMIYCVFLFANLHDLPGYLEMKAEDWQKWMKK